MRGLDKVGSCMGFGEPPATRDRGIEFSGFELPVGPCENEDRHLVVLVRREQPGEASRFGLEIDKPVRFVNEVPSGGLKVGVGAFHGNKGQSGPSGCGLTGGLKASGAGTHRGPGKQ